MGTIHVCIHVRQVPIWVRNIQLGLISLVLGLGSAIIFDGGALMNGGFFQGYTLLTWFVVLQVCDGVSFLLHAVLHPMLYRTRYAVCDLFKVLVPPTTFPCFHHLVIYAFM